MSRPRHIVPTLALLAACAHPPPPPVQRAPVSPAPPADAPAAGPTARVVRRRAPEAAPAEFAEHTVARDVDGDGRDDLVRELPVVAPGGGWTAEEDFAPLVAHRLADGRYALDDEVTRAHLRALCPAPPEARPLVVPTPADAARDVPRARQALLLDGVCLRAWGASLGDAIAGVREVARRSDEALFPPETVDAIVGALRTVPVPLELEALDVPPLDRVPLAPSPAPPDEPASAACAAVNRANTALLARASRALGPDADLGTAFQVGRLCVASGAGAWAIPLVGLPITRSNGTVRFVGALTWRPATGPARVGPRLTFLVEGQHHVVRSALLAAADYDGDGSPEVIVRSDDRDSEAGTERTFVVDTVREGRVQPYAAARGVEDVRDVVDADHDGRPDLVRASPWHRAGDCGYMGSAHDGPPALARSLPGGTFATDDLARAWTRSRCVREPDGYIPRLPDVLDVACARLRGVPAEQVIAALRSRVPADGTRFNESFDDPCLSFPALASVALQPL